MNMKALRGALLCGLCGMLVFGVANRDLRGYVTNGHRWAGSQVLYYVNPNSIQLSPSAAIQAFQTAANGWSTQTAANVDLVYAGTTSGTSLTMNNKNEMFFRNDSNGYLGETYWWYDASGSLVDADMVVHEGGLTLFTGTSGCSGGVILEDLAIHEFGHVLGLAHSSVAGATMEPSMPSYCDTTQLSLESDDKQGIESLYPGGATLSPPAAPSQLAVNVNLLNPTQALSLSWADNSNNETGFRVERSLDGLSFVQVAQLGTNVRTFTDSGLLGGLLYYYRVYAYNDAGLSGYSNVAGLQTQIASPLAAPTLSVSGSKVKRGYRADLRWSGLSSSSVDVYRNGARTTTTANDGAYTDTVKSAGTYSYQLCAAGTSTCSNAVSVTF